MQYLQIRVSIRRGEGVLPPKYVLKHLQTFIEDTIGGENPFVEEMLATGKSYKRLLCSNHWIEVSRGDDPEWDLS